LAQALRSGAFCFVLLARWIVDIREGSSS